MCVTEHPSKSSVFCFWMVSSDRLLSMSNRKSYHIYFSWYFSQWRKRCQILRGGARKRCQILRGAVTLLFQLESTVYCLFLSFSNKRIGGDRTPSRSKCPPLIFLQIPNLMLFIQHYHQIIPLLNLNKLVALGLNLGHLHNNSTSLYLNSPKLAGWIRISTNYE